MSTTTTKPTTALPKRGSKYIPGHQYRTSNYTRSAEHAADLMAEIEQYLAAQTAAATAAT